MEKYIQKALENHSKRYNCAQAVACSFADVLNIDESLLFKACEGFGAGMGSRQNACGALSGAIMICGLVNSSGSCEDITKKQTYDIASELVKSFNEKCHNCVCEKIKQEKHVTCNDCVEIAVKLVCEKVLGEKC